MESSLVSGSKSVMVPRSMPKCSCRILRIFCMTVFKSSEEEMAFEISVKASNSFICVLPLRTAVFISTFLCYDCYFVSVCFFNETFPFQNNGFARFKSQYGSLCLNHSFKRSKSNGRNIKAHVLIRFCYFYHNHLTGSQSAAAQNGLIRTFNGFNR